MNFECLLLNAKAGNEDAITAILQMYRPLLLKYAIIDGVLDEDLYQECNRSIIPRLPKAERMWDNRRKWDKREMRSQKSKKSQKSQKSQKSHKGAIKWARNM